MRTWNCVPGYAALILAAAMIMTACGDAEGGPGGGGPGGGGGGGGGAYTPVWTAIPAGTGVGTTTFDTSRIISIAYGGGKFVAGGEDGKMAYSADGTSWTAIPAGTDNGTTTTFGTSNTISSIAYGGPAGQERFVAGAGNGKMAYSNTQ
jgi:hypothetical protein